MLKEITDFGILIDKYNDERNSEKLIEIILEIELFIENNDLDNNELSTLYYYVGNAWSSLDMFIDKVEENKMGFTTSEFDNSIINYRKSKLFFAPDSDNFQLLYRVLINLGNSFRKAGRPIEAIRFWDSAIELNCDTSMLFGHKGLGLFNYAEMVYDSSHRDIIGREAYKLLDKVDQEYVHSTAFNKFDSIRNHLYSFFGDEYLLKDFTNDGFSLEGKNEKENEYLQWVLDNRLFLNPLNDISKLNIVAHDILNLPDMIIPDNIDYNNPIFHRFYNEIKQEFLSLRYFYYLYTTMNETETHFSDINRNLTNTFDYSQYGLKYEYLKSSYKLAYSIFDKIAYFLNQYLDLEIPNHKVSFKQIWYSFDKKKERFSNKINEKLVELNNFPLNGLFFLSKDFYEKSNEFNEALDPDAKNIAKIRNYVEHKSLSIHWNMSSVSEKEEISYHVSENDFSEKCYFLITRCREAMIYLSLAVHNEEKKNKTENLSVPIYLREYDY